MAITAWRLVWICFLLNVFVFVSPLPSQTSDVNVTYMLSPAHVSLGEPIVMTLLISNNMAEPISVDLGIQQTQNVEFITTFPDGHKVDTRPALREGFGPIGIIKVKPGESYSKEFFLSGWLDFKEPGRYGIEVIFRGSALASTGPIMIPSVGHVTLDVDPRSEGQLRDMCSNLLAAILSAKTYGQAERAARALSTIKDPIAVTYLQKAAGSWHLEPIVIPALGQIGDTRAAMALMTILQTGTSDGRQVARSVLEQLLHQTADQDLKEVIQHALEPRKTGSQVVKE